MALKSKVQAVNTLLHGWGDVEGKWVYVPLWDPAPGYKAFRTLVASAAVADAAKLVSNKALAGKLHDVAGALVKNASAGFIKSWEEGDPICPPWPWPWRIPHWPHWPPFPWPPPPPPWHPHPPGPGPDPAPFEQFIRELDPVARNAVVGNMVVIIGESIAERSVIEVGREVMAAR